MGLNALADILQKLQSRSPKLREKIYEQRVLALWPKAVGPDITRHATASHYEKGVLTVRCEHPAWQNELRLQQSLILEKLNREKSKDEATRDGAPIISVVFKSPARERDSEASRSSWPKRRIKSQSTKGS